MCWSRMVHQQSDYHTMHSKRENTCLALLVLVGFKGLLRTSTSTSAVVCHFTLKWLELGTTCVNQATVVFFLWRGLYILVSTIGGPGIIILFSWSFLLFFGFLVSFLGLLFWTFPLYIYSCLLRFHVAMSKDLWLSHAELMAWLCNCCTTDKRATLEVFVEWSNESSAH